MAVFVSWSKDSRPVAELFCNWLPKVIQQVKVWYSGNIESGAKWFTTLTERLSENDFGVLMVTKKNLREPWLQFEAGALAKALHSRVTPVFCNLSPLDVVDTPLKELQGTKVDRAGFWKLVSDVNNACANPLDEARLKDSFELRWPEFEAPFSKVKFGGEGEAQKVETTEERIARIEDVLVDLLKSTTGTNQSLSSIQRALLTLMEDKVRMSVPIAGIGTGGVLGRALGVAPAGSLEEGLGALQYLGTAEALKGAKEPK
jgi:hypothetical protein